MKSFTPLASLSLALFATAHAAQSTGTPFYGDPPNATHPWAIHDQNRPQPKLVTPGTYSTPEKPGQPPSDAIVLFDGTEATLSKWEADTKPGEPNAPTKWVVKDGALECVPKSGFVRTKEKFADCQLHVEWAAPKNVIGDSQGRGNSGIFLMGLLEVQVLDNYNNPTYADGFAASVYGTQPPLANALRAPGEFQVYDIIFRRPIYKDGKAVDPGYVTVFCNGVLVQDHTPIEGPGGHMKRTYAGAFPVESGPLKLQDHGNPVRFRNIWYRPLPPRSIEGGTDGALTAEATTAKRKEIAAAIRDDAGKLNGVAQLLRVAESLVYENDPAVAARVESMAKDYMSNLTKVVAAAATEKANLKPGPDAENAAKTLEGNLNAVRDQAKNVQRAFAYLAKYEIVPATYGPKAALDSLIKAQGWDQPKK